MSVMTLNWLQALDIIGLYEPLKGFYGIIMNIEKPKYIEYLRQELNFLELHLVQFSRFITKSSLSMCNQKCVPYHHHPMGQ